MELAELAAASAFFAPVNMKRLTGALGLPLKHEPYYYLQLGQTLFYSHLTVTDICG